MSMDHTDRQHPLVIQNNIGPYTFAMTVGPVSTIGGYVQPDCTYQINGIEVPGSVFAEALRVAAGRP